MSKRLEQGVWIVVCDWKDPATEETCNLGYDGNPAMFVDPDGGVNPETHFQCGKHHNIVKQSEKEEYQLPADHKLSESTIQPVGIHTAENIGVSLEGFSPDAGGRVWDGGKIDKDGSND
jgi:hypothetical protein